MAVLHIPRALYDTFEGALEGRVEAFRAEIAAHTLTEGVAAPVEHPLVEALARSTEGFEVVEPAEAATPAPLLPTPLEWMDRLPEDRQVVLMEALDQTPEGRWFQRRMLAAREIDPRHPQTQAGVTMLLKAGVLTEDEAAALLA